MFPNWTLQKEKEKWNYSPRPNFSQLEFCPRDYLKTVQNDEQ